MKDKNPNEAVYVLDSITIMNKIKFTLNNVCTRIASKFYPYAISMSQPNAIFKMRNLLRIKSVGLNQAVNYLFTFFYIDSSYATLKSGTCSNSY